MNWTCSLNLNRSSQNVWKKITIPNLHDMVEGGRSDTNEKHWGKAEQRNLWWRAESSDSEGKYLVSKGPRMSSEQLLVWQILGDLDRSSWARMDLGALLSWIWAVSDLSGWEKCEVERRNVDLGRVGRRNSNLGTISNLGKGGTNLSGVRLVSG